MAKPISPTVHGVIDYLTVPLLLAAGPLFHFGGRPAEITSMSAGAVLVYSLFTRYRLGLVKMIPFSVHGMIDTVLAAAFLLMPFLFRFEDATARWVFLGLGLFALIVVALTDFRQASVSRD